MTGFPHKKTALQAMPASSIFYLDQKITSIKHSKNELIRVKNTIENSLDIL